MTPEVIAALVNMGSAGAVIAAIIIMQRAKEKSDAAFVQALKEQAKDWRDFFTSLDANNKGDIRALAGTMSEMVDALRQHDTQAKVILNIVSEVDKRTGKIDSELVNAVTVMKERTQPLPRTRKAAGD